MHNSYASLDCAVTSMFFLFRAKFSYSKLVKYLLLNILSDFVRLRHSQSIFCDIRNNKEINDIVKASSVKIMPLTRSLECEWISKPPLPTKVLDIANAPLPDILDIDNSGGNNSWSLSDVARCSAILGKNTPPSDFLPGRNNDYTSGDPRIFSQCCWSQICNWYMS